MHVLLGNGPWMTWNAILALVPLTAAAVLFTGDRRRLSMVWWLGASAFLAFLPNAPYVLTDALHLPGDLRGVTGRYGASAALLVQYGLLIAIGMGAYAGSLELLRRFLARRGWPTRDLARLELALHGLCAIGVLLGRFARFNSWDLGTRPGAVAEHLRVRLDDAGSWKLLLSTFAVLVIGTAVARVVGRALHATYEWVLRGPAGRA